MDTDLKFSVSMCVYSGDDAEWFKTAVDSILNQTIPPNEVVLVVDGPVPSALDSIISTYENNALFKIIRLKKNQGHGKARRICFENCSYDFVALMDADDVSVPERFEKQLNFFESNPNLSVVGGYINEFVVDPGNCIGKRIVPTDDAEIKKFMKKRCPMNQVTVMFKKASVTKAGGYLDWFCEEDYYLWLRMSLADMTFANVPEVLVNVRVGEEMYLRRGGWKYFKSEAKLQKFMLKNGIIGLPRYILNVTERLLLQVIMPNKIRGFIYQKLARDG